MFNAKNKREEMAGAAEVQEDCQLKVDLPIDQVQHSAMWVTAPVEGFCL